MIALAVGGYFLLAKDDEESSSDEASTSESSGNESTTEESSPENSSEESSTEETSSSESTPTETPAKHGDIGGPDDSLPSTYKDAMPAKVSDLINKCEEGTFTLRYDDPSKKNRDMTGAACKGVRGTPWAYWSVDFVNDKEYAEMKTKDYKNANATIVNDDPNEYAGYVEEKFKIHVFLVNKDKNILMESELFGSEPEDAKQLLELMGYSS